jgi:hypothetical protein
MKKEAINFILASAGSNALGKKLLRNVPEKLGFNSKNKKVSILFLS